jgi:hypothetical protein
MSSAFLYLGIVLMWLCVLVPMWLRRDRHTVDIAELYSDTEEESDGDTLTDVSVSEVPAARTALDADTTDDEITMELATTEPRTRTESRVQPHTHTESRVEFGGPPGARVEPGGQAHRGLKASGSLRAGDAAWATVPGEASSSGSSSVQEASAGTSAAEQDTSSGAIPGRHSDEDLSQTECRRRARVLARRRRWLLWTVLLHLASVVTAAVGVAPWWSVAPSGVLLVSYLAVLRIAVAVDAERRVEAAKARAEREQRERIERERELELAAQEAEAEIIEFRKRAEPFDQYADRPRRAVGD